MDADLVGAAAVQCAFYERLSAEFPKNFIVRACLASVFGAGHSQAVVRVASDRVIYRAAALCWAVITQCYIFFFDSSGLKVSKESLLCKSVSGGYHQSGRCCVKTVDYSWAFHSV